jgi:hypothetical protein
MNGHNALVQKKFGIGSRNCQDLSRFDFFNTCPNEASENSIDIYVKYK